LNSQLPHCLILVFSLFYVTITILFLLSTNAYEQVLFDIRDIYIVYRFWKTFFAHVSFHKKTDTANHLHFDTLFLQSIMLFFLISFKRQKCVFRNSNSTSWFIFWQSKVNNKLWKVQNAWFFLNAFLTWCQCRIIFIAATPCLEKEIATNFIHTKKKKKTLKHKKLSLYNIRNILCVAYTTHF
jgi:hypothetical protein